MIEPGRGLAAALPAALMGILALGAPASAAGQGLADGHSEGRAEAIPSLVVAGRGDVRAASGQLDVSAAVSVRYRIAPCPAQGGCGETP